MESPPGLYEAVAVFTPGLYRDTFMAETGDPVRALTSYLQSGTGLPISAAEVEGWQAATAKAAVLLAGRLHEPTSRFSASDEVLLAVPKLDPLPTSTEEINEVVRGFLAAVQAADRAGDERFLAVLAEYGRRYEMVVEVEVPLTRPCTVKVEEDLPLELCRGHWTAHRFALGEARSAHLEARAADPSVEIATFALEDDAGQDLTGWLESVRHTREALAIYSSETNRPRYARLRLRFRGAVHLLVTTIVLGLANLGAIAAVLFAGYGYLYLERVAVLALPTTIAATFVLTREQTTLGTRLLSASRAFLGVATLALWLTLAVMAGFQSAETAHSSQRPADRAR